MLPLIALLTAPTLQAPAPQPFAGLAFLEGRWIGEGFQAGASGEFSLEIRFEIAPPNKPEQFKVYQSG